LEDNQHRIVSLLPGATEIVADLGLRDALVGRSHECDFPLGIESLPICSEPVIDVSASSAEINRQVEKSLENALSIYRVDIERIRELRPTLILTQMQCEVCAVNEKDVRSAIAELSDPAPQILSLSPSVLDDLWRDIAAVAATVDADQAGKTLVTSLQQRLEQLRGRVRIAADRPRVACIEWLDPLMTAGNWVPELLEAAGCQNVLGQAGAHSPWLDWADLTEADADVILVFPCGFTLSRTRSEFPILAGHAEWSQLRAVRNGRVFLVDGHHYLNRPGPRLIDSAEIIAEVAHPELFEPVHRDVAWSACP